MNEHRYDQALKSFKAAEPLIASENRPLDLANTKELIAFNLYCTHFQNRQFQSAPEALADCRDGIELANDALKLKESQVGLNHPYLSYTLTKLARLYVAVSELDKAEAAWQRAIEIDSRSPQTEVRAADETVALARLLKEENKTDEAAKTYARGIELSRKYYGDNDSYIKTLIDESRAF
jgi:tetratricopeptide (TPR) repeat protein